MGLPCILFGYLKPPSSSSSSSSLLPDASTIHNNHTLNIWTIHQDYHTDTERNKLNTIKPCHNRPCGVDTVRRPRLSLDVVNHVSWQCTWLTGQDHIHTAIRNSIIVTFYYARMLHNFNTWAVWREKLTYVSLQLNQTCGNICDIS